MNIYIKSYNTERFDVQVPYNMENLKLKFLLQNLAHEKNIISISIKEINL
jgi:hypothetical protein